MRIGLVCVLLVACASAKKEAATSVATTEAGGVPASVAAPGAAAAMTAAPAAAKAPAPAALPASVPPSAASGPMTAAQAAAMAAKARGGAGDPPAAAGEADDSPCATDADCTFTRLAPGACCAMLCAPRAVTIKGNEALEAHARSCAIKRSVCPDPSCHPPRTLTSPACEQNKCVAKERPGDERLQ